MNEIFKAFAKIKRYDAVRMMITEKLHGTNGQIYIYEDGDKLNLKVGSRTRWIVPGDDNFGFAQFVYDRKDAIMAALGVGQHYGEFVGLGINGGYNMKDRQFFLFNARRWQSIKDTLPEGLNVVPILYCGERGELPISAAMQELQQYGSKASEGYMRPEGIVIELDGVLYKKTFSQEDSKWHGSDPNKPKVPRHDRIDASDLLQPMRLEKLLSRDSRYKENYPQSLPTIVKDYLQDLIDENQIEGSEAEIKGICKGISSQVFNFVKSSFVVQ